MPGTNSFLKYVTYPRMLGWSVLSQVLSSQGGIWPICAYILFSYVKDIPQSKLIRVNKPWDLGGGIDHHLRHYRKGKIKR